MTQSVLYETRGAVAIMTLNRPKQRNSVNIEVTESLRAALARAEADPDVRVVILTGNGDVFCAGMDLAAFVEGDGDAILSGEGRFAGFVDAPRSKPLIAAVNGPALAGGFELALACDLIVASETAFFSLPEPKVGIFACAGGPFRLARKIPPAKALELALTAERLSAQDACSVGLANAVCKSERVLDTALELAERILENAPLGISATLALSRALAAQAEQELWALNERLLRDVAASNDAIEGPKAFLQKRRPKWTGQ
jgi:enoyl-CoA hydratase